MCNLCAFLDSKEVHTATMRIPVFLNLGIAETKQWRDQTSICDLFKLNCDPTEHPGF